MSQLQSLPHQLEKIINFISFYCYSIQEQQLRTPKKPKQRIPDNLNSKRNQKLYLELILKAAGKGVLRTSTKVSHSSAVTIPCSCKKIKKLNPTKPNKIKASVTL